MAREWTHRDSNALLAVIASFDNRKVQPEHVEAWTQLARQGRWTPELAAQAVKDHFLTSSTWLTPAMVHDRVRAAKNDAHDRLVAAREHRDDQRRPRNVAELIEQGVQQWTLRSDDDGAAARQLGAITAPCGHCNAFEGSPCTRGTGERQVVVAPHPSRHDWLAHKAGDLAHIESGVGCPLCGARPNYRCVNVHTGSYLSFRYGTHYVRMEVENSGTDTTETTADNAHSIRVQAHREWESRNGGDQ